MKLVKAKWFNFVEEPFSNGNVNALVVDGTRVVIFDFGRSSFYQLRQLSVGGFISKPVAEFCWKNKFFIEAIFISSLSEENITGLEFLSSYLSVKAPIYCSSYVKQYLRKRFSSKLNVVGIKNGTKVRIAPDFSVFGVKDNDRGKKGNLIYFIFIARSLRFIYFSSLASLGRIGVDPVFKKLLATKNVDDKKEVVLITTSNFGFSSSVPKSMGSLLGDKKRIPFILLDEDNLDYFFRFVAKIFLESSIFHFCPFGAEARKRLCKFSFLLEKYPMIKRNRFLFSLPLKEKKSAFFLSKSLNFLSSEKVVFLIGTVRGSGLDFLTQNWEGISKFFFQGKSLNLINLFSFFSGEEQGYFSLVDKVATLGSYQNLPSRRDVSFFNSCSLPSLLSILDRWRIKKIFLCGLSTSDFELTIKNLPSELKKRDKVIFSSLNINNSLHLYKRSFRLVQETFSHQRAHSLSATEIFEDRFYWSSKCFPEDSVFPFILKTKRFLLNNPVCLLTFFSEQSLKKEHSTKRLVRLKARKLKEGRDVFLFATVIFLGEINEVAGLKVAEKIAEMKNLKWGQRNGFEKIVSNVIKKYGIPIERLANVITKWFF